MLWKEFVGCLDKIRSDIRARRNLNEQADLREVDSVIADVYKVLNGVNILVPIVVEVPTPQPEIRKELPAGANRVSLSSSEGTMVVMPRETPFVPKKPKLEEVFDDELLATAPEEEGK